MPKFRWLLLFPLLLLPPCMLSVQAAINSYNPMPGPKPPNNTVPRVKEGLLTGSGVTITDAGALIAPAGGDLFSGRSLGLPILTATPSPAPSGYVRLYWRDGALYGLVGGAELPIGLTYGADGSGLEIVNRQFRLELDGLTLGKGPAGLKVSDQGIGSAQLAPGSVGHAQLAVGAVQADTLADGAVTAPKFSAGAITQALGTGALSGAKLTDNSVDGAKLIDASVPAAKLAIGAAVGNLGDGTLAGAKLIPGTIGTTQLADAAVTYPKLPQASANAVLTRADAAAGPWGETVLNASQLLGRGPSGPLGPIGIGSGLNLTGTTLSATALVPSFCRYSGIAARGTTNTNVFRYATAEDGGCSGDALSYSSSAANGDSFPVAVTGRYMITVNLKMSLSADATIRIGTSLDNLTATDSLTRARKTLPLTSDQLVWAGPISSGSRIWVSGGALPVNLTPQENQISIVRIN